MDIHDTDDDFGARTVSRPMMDGAELPLCACGEFYQAHHPQCPAKRHADRLHARNATLTKELDTAKAFTYWVELERDKLQELYNDLLMQVASKHPNETRHETAKRYIVQAEAVCSIATKGDSDAARAAVDLAVLVDCRNEGGTYVCPLGEIQALAALLDKP